MPTKKTSTTSTAKFKSTSMGAGETKYVKVTIVVGGKDGRYNKMTPKSVGQMFTDWLQDRSYDYGETLIYAVEATKATKEELDAALS